MSLRLSAPPAALVSPSHSPHLPPSLSWLCLLCSLLLQPPSRDEVLYGNRVVVTYLLDALEHNSQAVRRAADETLELVVDLDVKATTEPGSLSGLIRKKRFEAYNREWFATMGTLELEQEHEQAMFQHEQDLDNGDLGQEEFDEDEDHEAPGESTHTAVSVELCGDRL